MFKNLVSLLYELRPEKYIRKPTETYRVQNEAKEIKFLKLAKLNKFCKIKRESSNLLKLVNTIRFYKI